MNGFYLKKHKVNLKEDENDILLAIANACVSNEIVFEYNQVNTKFENYKTRLYKITESDIFFADYTDHDLVWDKCTEVCPTVLKFMVSRLRTSSLYDFMFSRKSIIAALNSACFS